MDQPNGGAMFGLYRLFNWLTILAYLNILWMLFSLLGLGLFGIGPATLAVFSIIRDKLQENESGTIWRSFYLVFKNNFWRGNKLFIVIFLVFSFIFIDFAIIRALPYHPVMAYVVIPALIILTALWILISSYTFALQTHYQLKFWQIFRDAFWISGIFPLSSLGIIFVFFIIIVLNYWIPAIIPFYLVSVPIFAIQLIALVTFKQIEAKKFLLEEEQKNGHRLSEKNG
ncbi:YesL family protein [Amphibacillus sp. Q70]|uniref:YesL family protein n=1 Tax=Amphibacillus sp. Q70 TaxID=3453416 RepID=UPI003F86D6DB